MHSNEIIREDADLRFADSLADRSKSFLIWILKKRQRDVQLWNFIVFFFFSFQNLKRFDVSRFQKFRKNSSIIFIDTCGWLSGKFKMITIDKISLEDWHFGEANVHQIGNVKIETTLYVRELQNVTL